MITALVQFPLSGADLDEVRQYFVQVAPAFRQPEGLLRKHFILAEGGGTGGGVYLWRTREQAEQFYEGGFRERIRDRFGAAPTITYFETVVVVDNVTGEVSAA